MDPKPVPRPDPLIDEVRQRRREVMAEYGNDLDRLFEAVRAIEATHPQQMKDPRSERALRPKP
jgi:hypothetical protein